MLKNKKNLYIGLFVIFLLILFIGTAYLTEHLKINGTTTISQNNWSIVFDNVVENGCNTVEVMNHAVKINNDNHKIGFDIAFNHDNDTYDFVVDLVNNGTIDAMIDDFKITGIPETDNSLSYSITYLDDQPLSECDPLYANSTRKIKISFVLLNTEEYVFQDDTTYHLTLSIEFKQLDDKSCDINEYNDNIDFEEDDYASDANCEEEIKYNLYINPNRGLYRGSKRITVVKGLTEGYIEDLGDDPVKPGYRFLGWKPNNSEYVTDYNETDNTVTMGASNAYIEALYELDSERVIARINDVYYPTIQAAFDDAVPGDTIYLLDNTSEDPINELKEERPFTQKNVIFDLGGFTVEGQLINEDVLTLINGTWINPSGVAVINKGTLELGIDDGEVDDENVSIIGSEDVGGLGIDQRGTFNFYDGYVQGYIGIAGSVRKTPVGYYVFVEHENVSETNDEYQKAHLILQPSRAVAKTVSDGGAIFYLNLRDAFNVATMLGYDVIVVRDFPAAYPVIINEGKAITFDLAGNNIEFGTDFINNGTVTMLDSGLVGNSNKKGTIKLAKTIENNGDLTINGMELTLENNFDLFNSKGNLTISKSRLTTQNGYVFKIEDGTSLIMDDETYLNANNYAIYSEVKGDNALTIQGGHINGIYNRGNLVIEEGTDVYQTNSVNRAIYYSVDYNKTGLLTINGGSVSINDDDGGSAIYCDGSGTKGLEINGGLISSTSNLSNKNTIAIQGSCSVTLNDGEVKAVVNESATAYAFADAGVTVNGGTVTAKATKGTSTISSGGSITTNGGVLDADGLDVKMFSGNTTTINNGTITADGTNSSVIFGDTATSTINDGTMSSNFDCIHLNSNKTLNGGTLTCGEYGVRNTSPSGTFTMNGGEINSVDSGVWLGYVSRWTTHSNRFVMTGGRIVSSNSYGLLTSQYESYGQYTVLLKASTDNINNNTYPYIEGKTTGFMFESGTANVEVVNIVGKTEYGMYSKGNAIMGANDGDISTTQPMIKGELYGLYTAEGTMNIYDGIFKGQTDGFYGNPDGLADGAGMVDGTETIDSVLYNTDYLQTQDDFLKIIRNENGTEKEYYYNSLQYAVDSIEESDTIYVIMDHNVKSDTVIPVGKNVTLDFSGFNLDNSKSITINGTLTLKNTTEDATTGGMDLYLDSPINNNGKLTIEGGNYTNLGKRFITNKSTLSILGGKIDLTYDSTNAAYGIENIAEYGVTNDITFANVEFNINGNGAMYGVINTGQGHANIVVNSGTFNLKYYTSSSSEATLFVDSSYYGHVAAEVITANVNVTLANGNKASVMGSDVTSIIRDGTYTVINPNGPATIGNSSNTTIYDGTYTSTAANAYISDNADVMTIHNGTFTTTGTTNSELFSGSSGATVVNNGTFESNKKCMTISSGDKTINGGTFTCSTYGVSDGGYNRTFTMTGGSITSSKNNTLDFSSSGYQRNIRIYGGTITSNKGYALYSNNSANNIVISADATNIENGTYPSLHGTTYGVYIDAGNGTIDKATIVGDTKNGIFIQGNFNIGTDDGVVSNEYPMIMGRKYGLFINDGLVNVYDGIFKGINEGYNGTITGFADGYTFISDTEDIDGTEYMVSYLGQLGDFLKVGDETFNSLQSAIDYIEGTGTIEVIASHDIKIESTIPAGKNITLDSHGYTLVDTKSIINNGTLTLVDLSDDQNGGISSSASESFVNNGTLNVVSGKYISTGNTLYKNTGNIVIDGGESKIIATINSDTFGVWNKVVDNNPVNITINDGLLYVEGKGSCYGIFVDRQTLDSINLNDGTIRINGTGSGSTNVYAIYSSVGTYNAIYNTVTIKKGTYEVSSLSTQDTYSYGTSITHGVHTNFIDGTFTVTNPNGRGGISQNGTIEVTNGTYTINAKTAVSFDYNAAVTINNGTFKNTGTSGAVITSGNTSNSTINNGTFTSSHQCADMYNGSLTINNGTFTCGSYGVGSTRGSSTLTLNGGTMNTVGNGIDISDGNANIYGGTIVSSRNYGVYSKNSGNNILINTSVENIQSSNNVYIEGANSGVYINNGTVTFGAEDGVANKDNFHVSGGEYGIYNYGGVFKYFDGTLKGKTRGYLGTITTIEAGNYIYQENYLVGEDEWTLNYLKPDTDFVKNLSTNVDYNNLKNAFDEAGEGDTLQFFTDFQLYYPVEIGSSVNAILDLAGYNLVLSAGVVNKGNVKITNSSTTNTSIISSGLNLNLLKNDGTLEIEKVKLQNIKSANRPIVTNNHGVTTLRNVTIDSINGVYTYAGGETNIYNTTINATDTAIYDAGKTYVKDSTVNGTNYGIYSTTNTDGTYEDSTVTTSNASYYKYNGSSNQELNNVDFSSGYVYSSGGSSNITGGTINRYIVNHSNMKIDGTTINDNETLNYYGNYTSISNDSTLTMEDVDYTFAVNKSDVYRNDSIGKYNNSYIYAISNSGVLNLNDNSIQVSKSVDHWSYMCRYDKDEECPYHMYFYTIYNTGTANLNGNEIGVHDTSSQKSGRLNDYYYGMVNVNNGVSTSIDDKLVIDGGLYAYGLYDSTAKTTSVVRNIDVDITNVKYGYGLYSQNGSYTIESGDINVSGKSVYGAYLDKAKVTLGIFDGSGTINDNVNLLNPLIKAIGTESGIGIKYVDGEINHYDGKIIASTSARPSMTTLVETGYESTIYYDSEGGYEYCVLEFLDTQSTVNENMTVVSNNVYYKTIEDAISRVKDGDIIKVLTQINADVVNNSEHSFTLDLNEHTITGTLTNNGTMTIINGQITSASVTPVINTGTLNIGVYDGNIIYDNVVIKGISVGIQNSGKVYLFDGNIIGDRAYEGNKVLTAYNYKLNEEILDGFDTMYVTEATDATIGTGTSYGYEYTGEESVFTAPTSGYYRLETWGAQGGAANDTVTGGYGAYASGIVYLNSGDSLYINVGGQGANARDGANIRANGGYNGGGYSYQKATKLYAGAGGGATSIATSTGTLSAIINKSNVLLVAAGGSGAFVGNGYSIYGNSGGGYIGGNTNGNVTASTQKTGFAFGQGDDSKYNYKETLTHAGGGGGYYGGISAEAENGASGGSSYIGNNSLLSMGYEYKCMYGYNVLENTNEDLYTISVNNYSEQPTSKKPKAGDGYAKITKLTIN